MICLEADGSGEIEVVLSDEAGGEERLPRTTPERDLILAAETDYSAYCKELRRLRESHPLFEETLDVRETDLQDLTAQARALAEALREIDPVAHFTVAVGLDAARRMRDDGSASFLLRAGQRQLLALEEPIRAQVRLRNIFDVTFDGMERATQRERYEKLQSIYPDAIGRHYRMRWMEEADGAPLSDTRAEYAVSSLYELRLLELALYFRQEKRRIARCEFCWGYFVPKTSHATAYCDRAFGGKTCKQLGPNLKRFMGPEQDEALRVCDQLRRRMAARLERYEGALADEQARRIKMDTFQYRDWSELARDARMAYLRRELTTEEFLRRIDVYHELESYEVSAPSAPGKSLLQRRVEQSIDFDPATAYQTMQVLDLGDPDPAWRIETAEEQARQERRGHESLREKYGKA
ncbi:MAG: hypothetical protein E7422_11100 [Ruminococcaceae bacterium]|nr:hypothetical protein [Oscillospiraceae bacterium]